ncbi:MAG: cbb3-type cytochrome oxidase assembly protein CcoS [Microvirga sp.]|nr:cbb3-type cytochrome oxidase assembly protein CcoS [Microvirga sp.]
MNVILYLLPVALGLGLLGLVAFLWSLRSGQYEDLEGAALRILDDDDIETGDEDDSKPGNRSERRSEPE